MISIFRKEIAVFLSSMIGYVVIAVFLLITGLFIWFFSDTSVLNFSMATMDQLFLIGPFVLLILIPAITMRSFSEEYQYGTIELLYTKPLSLWQIIGGKFMANFSLVLLALIPTLIYVYSIYQLGSPVGNLDVGGTIGSYIGLVLLSASFTAIGMWASSMMQNQISGFLFSGFMCFMFFWGADYISRIPSFSGGIDYTIQQFGMKLHYDNLSRGLVRLSDVIYFLTIISLGLLGCHYSLQSRKQ